MGSRPKIGVGILENLPNGRARFKGGLVMAEFVESIFLAPEGGAQMKGVQAATTLESCGLEGDRYCALEPLRKGLPSNLNRS